MTKLEKVIKGLECATGKYPGDEACSLCPYQPNRYGLCKQRPIKDALELLKAQQCMTGFEVLDEISSAYGGKQIFFLQDNGLIYDRYEAEYITLEEAVSRMAQRVGDDGGV